MSQAARGAVGEAIFWLLFAGVAFAVTYSFDQPLPTYEFGPAGWPRALLVGMAVAALALLISALRGSGTFRPSPATAAASGFEPTPAGPPPSGLKTALTRLATFVLPLAYVLAMAKVGFLLVTPFFLVAYMYTLGLRRWWVLVWVALGIYALVVVIFVRLLFTPLPQGVGFFHSLNGKYVSLIR